MLIKGLADKTTIKKQTSPLDCHQHERSYGEFFLDSGAHSLYTIHIISKQHKDGYAFYESKEFWEYVDSYAKFVKRKKDQIEYYANVDVIFNPELSWKVQKYLEKEHKLSPIPVIHFGTDLKWVKKHLDAGYDFIGLGGLGQEATRTAYIKWADSVYNLLCPKPKRLPLVKTHGFAMTSYQLMVRWPWFSVDSASWVKAGAYGFIFVPHKRDGKFTFEKEPYRLTVSLDSPKMKQHRGHVYTMSGGKNNQIYKTLEEWIEFIGVEMGVSDNNGNTIKKGIINNHETRYVANLRFFQMLCDWLPKWPWPLLIRTKEGLLR